MKCKYCGGNISLEMAYCPYCGKPNEHAMRHAKEMQEYQEVYEQTRNDVQEKAHRFTGTTVRVIVIALLVLVIVGLLVLAGNGYALKRAWKQNQAEKHAQEMMAQMDAYLEEEDFIAFTSFCEENYIDTYETVFEAYVPVDRAARSFSYVYMQIMRIACPPTYAEQDSQISVLAEQLNYFYEALDMTQYEYYENIDEEKAQVAFAAMEEKVNVLLMSYCGLTKEEAESLKGMSEAQRAVTIEEAVLNEK